MVNCDATMTLNAQRGIPLGVNPAKGRDIIQPQPNIQIMLGRQLPRQAPANTDIAVIIDNFTKNIPAQGHNKLPYLGETPPWRPPGHYA